MFSALTQDIREIKETWIKFFHQLLSMEEELDNTQMEEIMENILNLVSDEQNRRLIMPFSNVEIKHTIFSMACNKSPSPDGFSIEFFQIFWGIVGA